MDENEHGSLVMFLSHDGKFGKEPDWHKVLQAARYCKIAPWEMEAHPEWMVRALAAIAADKEVRERNERKARRAIARAGGR